MKICISHAQFSAASPSLVPNSNISYGDVNQDGLSDVTLVLSSGGSSQNLVLLGGSGGNWILEGSNQSSRRRVLFIHTDLLGSPLIETDENGNIK